MTNEQKEVLNREDDDWNNEVDYLLYAYAKNKERTNRRKNIFQTCHL